MFRTDAVPMSRALEVALRRALSLLLMTTVLAVAVAGPVHAAPASAARTCFGREATIVGTDRLERITGTPGDDVIVSLKGADTVDGGGGDDRICTGRGADRVSGGPGDDLIGTGRDFRGIDADEPVGDVVSGGPGDDQLFGGPGVSSQGRGTDVLTYADARRGVVLDLSRQTARGQGHDLVVGFEIVVGSAHRDVLRGTGRRDVLEGGAGPDLVLGRDGVDLVEGGPGRDIVDAGRGYDIGFGGPGDDTVRAGASSAQRYPDELYGEAGDDLVEGTSGPDALSGDAGDDVLRGYGGRDRGYGGPGSDRCFSIERATSC